MNRMIIFISFCIILITGCGSSQKNETSETKVCIDWVDVIKFNDITYTGNRHISDEMTGDIEIGEVYDTVAFKISDVVMDPNYELKEGDSAFHEIGTPVYEIIGYSSEFRLAIKTDYGIRIYEASDNPNARRGQDLLDIDSKVVEISLNSEEDGITPLGVIVDVKQVSGIISSILSSPIDNTIDRNYDNRYFIEFHLNDNSSVIRNLLPNSHMIGDGIIVDKDTMDVLLDCLERETLSSEENHEGKVFKFDYGNARVLSENRGFDSVLFYSFDEDGAWLLLYDNELGSNHQVYELVRVNGDYEVIDTVSVEFNRELEGYYFVAKFGDFSKQDYIVGVRERVDENRKHYADVVCIPKDNMSDIIILDPTYETVEMAQGSIPTIIDFTMDISGDYLIYQDVDLYWKVRNIETGKIYVSNEDEAKTANIEPVSNYNSELSEIIKMLKYNSDGSYLEFDTETKTFNK